MVDEALIKPIHWEGYDEARAVWRPVGARGATIASCGSGLQLANRTGPVTEDDLVAFCGEVQEVALALAAEADFPDTDAALARARGAGSILRRRGSCRSG